MHKHHHGVTLHGEDAISFGALDAASDSPTTPLRVKSAGGEVAIAGVGLLAIVAGIGISVLPFYLVYKLGQSSERKK